ncbi:3-deoxy-D-manno-octulosonic-acid transferase [compost metagenome]
MLIGPYTYNFADAVELAMAAGAAIQVPDAVALAREAGRLLRDSAAARRMGEAGLAFCSAHRGATARVLEMITLQNR